MNILITDLLSHIFLAVNSQGSTFLVIALGALFLLTFTISGAEVALFSLNEKDVNMLKTKQHATAKRIITLLEEPKEVYASLLIGGTIINIGIIVLLNYLISTFIDFHKFGQLLEFLIKAVSIAFILVFVGKIFPKVWASQNNLRFAYGSSFVVEALHLLLGRVSKWVVKLADNIGRGAGAHRSDAMSMREMDAAIDVQPEEQSSQEEKNIMKGIVKFSNITVRQIMRSRLDVSGLNFKSGFGDVIRKVEELHYSRLPVFKESLDNVVGLVNTKDLVPYIDEEDNYEWQKLMRQPYFVPETKLIEDLLREFQQKRIHFAVVVDEFGGTSGIVTMEDIIEEVIGEIKDEFDEEESVNRKIDEQNYIFDGKTMIHDLCKAMLLPVDTFDKVRGESESVAGLILEIAGEIPSMNSVITSGDFEFTVQQTHNNRIQQVKVSIKPRLNPKDGKSSTVVVLWFLIFSLIAGCNSEYHPETKKKGYFRVSFPEKKYQLFERPGYPYTFEYPVYATVSKDSTFFDDKAEDWWVNIDFPQFRGRAFISYKEIGKNDLNKLVNDAFTMRSKQHINVSTGIEDSAMVTPNGTEGIFFSLGGNTATANQFFLTDSTKHFLRGALYFDATPNADSLSVVNDFLKKDLLHLINTLRWR